jgi:hypothetical protein
MAFIFITDGMVFTGGLELGCFGPGGAAEIAADDRLFKSGNWRIVGLDLLFSAVHPFTF